ncbi:hypothetical protein WA026_006850 [Henosepilachna vigintioctopunctata]|uniref:P53 and DNA damage-regulated protein 1 n=1 Tax=Henosepilachna vigintioctopunctata TaxID=420089 RepID=A0AAW1UGZ7_9CUCU
MDFHDIQIGKTFTYLKEVETVAQDILTLKDTKLELSNAQNKFREALRAIEQSTDRCIWMKEGSVFIQRPRQECIEKLRQEIEKSKEDINGLHDTIKDKLSELRDLEHEPGIVGFSLKPLSITEAKTLHKAFGSEVIKCVCVCVCARVLKKLNVVCSHVGKATIQLRELTENKLYKL